MAPVGAPDRAGREVGRLDDDVRRPVVQLGGPAAHDARQADGARVVGDEQVLGAQGALDVVERGEPLAGGGPAHDDRAQQRVGVVAVQRLARLEHDVVGDVDGQADRAHAGGLEPVAHPRRGGRVRIDAVDAQGDEQLAVVRLDAHRVGVLGRVGHATRVEVVVGHIEGLRGLAGQAPHRQCMAQVGGHVDVEDLVGNAEQRHRVGAETGPGRLRRREHDDAGAVLADAQLVGGADHAVAHVPVGPAGADPETAGQHRAGQRDDDVVALGEVAGAADDAAGVLDLGVDLGVVERAHVDAAPADGFPVALGFLDEVQDAADDDPAAHVGADGLDVLDLQTHPGEGVRHLGAGHAVRELHQIAEPTHRRPHRAPPTSERLNLTSPSTKSRRSGALLRNMTVRSTPMPKAKPE